MQGILWDLIKADALSQTITKNDTSQNIQNKKIYYITKILSIHKISHTQLLNSWAYYQNHPSILKILIDSMNNQQRRSIEEKIPALKKPLIS